MYGSVIVHNILNGVAPKPPLPWSFRDVPPKDIGSRWLGDSAVDHHPTYHRVQP